jgi:hypothetical protein
MNRQEMDPRRARAVGQLDVAARVLPGLMASLRGRAELARQAREIAGVPDETWRAMGIDERVEVLRRARRIQHGPGTSHCFATRANGLAGREAVRL